MGKRIIIPTEKKEIVKTVEHVAPCIHCRTMHSTKDAAINNRKGFCGKRCERYHFKNSIKWKNGKDRTARQNNRMANLKESLNFYMTREWRDLRFKVLRKYGFSCMACGSKPPIKLHVDHIKPRSKHPELELAFENLQVLCEDCNLGKCNYSEEDLRPA